MVSFHFKHVCIESIGLNLPTKLVTSDELEEQLSPLYRSLQIPKGTLEKLSGVKTRYQWTGNPMPSAMGTIAAERALEQIGFARSEVRGLMSCSVTRDFFEPATACLIHQNLKLDEGAVVMDISNACIGFSDGLMMMGHLIEAGVIPAGVVVSAEVISKSSDVLMRHFEQNPGLTREDLLKLLPSLTLGSGAVAYVLAHDTIATNKHRILGGTVRAATQFSDLCKGNGDYCSSQTDGYSPIMETEASKLITSAAALGGRMWPEASEALGWRVEDIDHIFCHQVGKQVNDSFYREMGLPRDKEFIIYPEYGNLVSAALPTCFAMGIEKRCIKRGDKVLFTAFGSGLNSIFMGIEW